MIRRFLRRTFLPCFVCTCSAAMIATALMALASSFAPTLRAADSNVTDIQTTQSGKRPASNESPAKLTFSLQSRDEDGKPRVREESIDPRSIGIVVVDPWNFHWCKTATMRVDALIPRINRSLEACRSLGMTVMLCPSEPTPSWITIRAIAATHPVKNRRIRTCPTLTAGSG